MPFYRGVVMRSRSRNVGDDHSRRMNVLDDMAGPQKDPVSQVGERGLINKNQLEACGVNVEVADELTEGVVEQLDLRLRGFRKAVDVHPEQATVHPHRDGDNGRSDLSEKSALCAEQQAYPL